MPKLKHLILIFLILGLANILACAKPEEKKQKFYEQAKVYFLEGKYTEARLEIKNALSIDSKFAKGYALLGRCEFKLKNWKKAYSTLNKAVELDPSLHLAQTTLARLLLMAGQKDKALEKVNLVLKEKPRHPQARLVQAGIHLQSKEFSQAEEKLKKLIKDDPENAEAHLLLAESQYQQEKIKQAEQTLVTAKKEIPDNKDINFRLLKFYMSNQDHPKAESLIQEMVDKEPDSKPLRLLQVRFYQETNQLDKAASLLKKIIKDHPKDQEYRLGLAQIYLNSNSTAKAEEYLLNSMQDFKAPYKIVHSLADFYLNQNRPGEATALYQKALKFDPTSPKHIKILNSLAQLKARQGKLDQATELLQKVFKENPQDIQGHMLMGNIHLQKREPVQAISEFRQAAEASDEHPEASLKLAQAHFMNNEPELGQNTLKNLLKKKPDYAPARELLLRYHMRNRHWQDAEAQLEALLKQEPENPKLLAVKGDIYLQNKGPAEAKKQYQSIIDLGYPEMGNYKLGQLHLREKEYPQAVKRFDAVLAKSKNFLPAIKGKIQALLQNGQDNQAAEYCQGLIQSNSSAVQYYELLGQVESYRKNYQAAEEAFLKAIELSPNNPLPYQQIYALYQDETRLKQGIARMQDMLEKNPDSVQIQFILGLMYQRYGSKAKAQNTYQEILDQNPDFLPAANNLAFMIAEDSTGEKDLQKALKLAKQAAESGASTALDTLGWVYYRQGNLEMALKNLNQALEKNPGNPSILYHLAEVMLKKNDEQEALELAQQALDLERNFPEREQTEKIIQSLQAE